MNFTNPIAGGGGALTRVALKSPNYVTGVSGWTIRKDGSAEFSDATFRGDVIASSFATDVAPNRRVEIKSADLGTIEIYGEGTDDVPSLIYAEDINVGTVLEANQIFFRAAEINPTYFSPFVRLTSNPSSLIPPEVFLDADGGSVVVSDRTDSFQAPNFVARSFGTAATPVIRWASDADTGMWRPFANAIGFAAGGIDQGYIDGTAWVPAKPIRLSSGGHGSAAAPAYSFALDNDTGMYRDAADALGFSTGGTQRFLITTTAMFAPGMRTTTAGGLVVERSGSAGNELYAETSTAALKEDVRERPLPDAMRLLDVPRVDWTSMETDGASRARVITPDKPESMRGQTWQRPGWLAEDMAKHHPQACVFDDDGRPVGIDRGVVIADLVSLVADLYDQVVALKEET